MFRIKLVERRNPLLPTDPKKFYATQINQGIMEMDAIAREISERSTTTYPDILSVLQNFLEFLPFLLKLGYSIRLGDFGTIRVAISSEGVNTPDEFNTSLIYAPKVLFRSSPKLKEQISKLKFETIK